MLIGRHGNTLEALNLIFNNALNAGVRNNRRYYTIDAEGYRAPRRAAKSARARDAGTLRTRRPAAEARTDAAVGTQDRAPSAGRFPVVRTESEGEEPERRVVVFPAESLRRDTIAAIATPPGRGAIAIVRAAGPARRLAARLRAHAARRCGRASRPTRDPRRTRAPLDRGLAIYFPAPQSYTGEDVLELHVTAPRSSRAKSCARCSRAARALAAPGEFTRRAFLNGKIDLHAAEAVADVIDAETRPPRAPRSQT